MISSQFFKRACAKVQSVLLGDVTAVSVRANGLRVQRFLYTSVTATLMVMNVQREGVHVVDCFVGRCLRDQSLFEVHLMNQHLKKEPCVRYTRFLESSCA